MADLEDSISVGSSNGVGSELETEKSFNFEKFSFHIKNSISEKLSPDDVDLENYLTAYEQLQNFFNLLGAAFQFVSADVRSKIKLLRSYQKKEKDKKQDNFTTVVKMISYEIDNNLLSSSKYVSGSRTLLRLHRGLDFTRKFLTGVFKLETDEKLGPIAREVYNDSLAEHHGWIVRNGVRAALQFLPSRIELLRKISDSKNSTPDEVLVQFPEALKAMDTVYDRVQSIYSTHDLLDLP